MNYRLKILLVFTGLLNSVCCLGQPSYVVVSNQSALRVIPKNAKISSLTNSEILQIEKITRECVTQYNSEITSSFKERGEAKYSKMYSINKLKKYNLQYVPYVTDKDEKEVWINGFCDGFNMNWKDEIVIVMDGGNCYFQIRMNISNETCIEIGVNGYS